MTSQQASSFDSLSLDDLSRVIGGESATDPTAVAKRASDNKPGHGSLDLFGYLESERKGVGAEVRHAITPHLSVFGRGQIGVKNDKPDNSIMGGVRIGW